MKEERLQRLKKRLAAMRRKGWTDKFGEVRRTLTRIQVLEGQLDHQDWPDVLTGAE